MKFQRFSLLSLVLIVLTISACSSEEDSPKPNEEPIDTKPQKLVSITFPTGTNMAYMLDKQEYKYDDKNRINLIGNYYAITYVSDDLIEAKTLGDDVSNSDIETKTSITLKNKNISSVISNIVFKRTTGVIYSIERDSTVYSYENEYIAKIVKYHKMSIDGDGKYRLDKQVDFQITDGNITQVKTLEYGAVVVSNYTYDSNPNILMGEIAYETPLFKVDGYKIIFHDKLGKKNKNNVISVENVFTETPFQKSYKTINFKRNLDSSGRISEILLTGSCVTSNPLNFATNFTDEKVIFEYK